VFHGYLDIS
jgi:transposase